MGYKITVLVVEGRDGEERNGEAEAEAEAEAGRRRGNLH